MSLLTPEIHSSMQHSIYGKYVRGLDVVRKITYRSKYQSHCFNCKRVEVLFMDYPFILLVAKPHSVYDLLYYLGLVYTLVQSFISVSDLVKPQFQS